MIYFTPRGFSSCPACESNFFTCSSSFRLTSTRGLIFGSNHDGGRFEFSARSVAPQKSGVPIHDWRQAVRTCSRSTPSSSKNLQKLALPITFLDRYDKPCYQQLSGSRGPKAPRSERENDLWYPPGNQPSPSRLAEATTLLSRRSQM